jgi:hypothetical protein
MTPGNKLPRGFKAVGFFLFFGAVMASLAGTTLLWKGTILDRIWLLNSTAHKQLLQFGRVAGTLFVLLGIVLAVAGAGWFKRRIWGWRLAVTVIGVQALGDQVNAFRDNVVKGTIGFAVAGAFLFYLLRSEVRSAFASRRYEALVDEFEDPQGRTRRR